MKDNYDFKQDRETTRFQLFGREVELAGKIDHTRNKDYYTQAIGVKSIEVVRINQPLSQREMAICCDGALALVENSPEIPNPISLFIFTSQSNTTDRVDLSQTHGFSIISYDNEKLEHYYFEKILTAEEESRRFQPVKEFCHEIEGPLDSDVLRLLLYANVQECALFPEATMFAFVGGGVENLFYSTKPDDSLQRSILLNSARNTGAGTLGLNEGSSFVALLDNDPGEELTCGHDGNCLPGGPKCVYDYQNPTNYCSHLDRPPDCSMSEIAAMQSNNLIVTDVPMNFKLLRDIRDKVMCRSTFGREYIGYYYLLSRHARYDFSAVKDYVLALPHVYSAATKLLSSGNVDDVIVTSEIRNRALTIIQKHRDIQDPEIQNILTRLETDVNRLHGLTKSAFNADVGIA